MRQSLEKSTKPFEAFSIPFFLGNATHKHLNRSSSFIPLILGLNSQGLTELIFWNSSRLVDFISEDHDRHFLELGDFEDTLQLDTTLLEALGVRGVHQVNDSIDVRNVVPPGLTGSFMTSQVPGLEGDFSHGEFFGVGLLGGVHLLHDVFLEAEQQSRLTSIIEP